MQRKGARKGGKKNEEKLGGVDGVWKRRWRRLVGSGGVGGCVCVGGGGGGGRGSV